MMFLHTHTHTKDVAKITEEEMDRIREFNQIDSKLYAYAEELFDKRKQSMFQSLPPEVAKLSFKQIKVPFISHHQLIIIYKL
jgi:hypothetical protein